MLTVKTHSAVKKIIAVHSLVIATLLCVALLVLSSVRAARGYIETSGTANCALTLQLQKSPFREQYKSKLAAKADHLFYDEGATTAENDTTEKVDYWDFSGKSAQTS